MVWYWLRVSESLQLHILTQKYTQYPPPPHWMTCNPLGPNNDHHQISPCNINA